MCLIINRDPRVTFDEQSFMTAVENNPDGYGLVVANGDGTCYVRKELKYNAKDLYKSFENDFPDNTVMLHLRYTTAGETNRRNLHPFPILEYETDGVDLWMTHNGTLTNYKPKRNSENKWESDTRVFVREFVRPLFKLLIKGNDVKDLLSNPLVEKILDEQLSAMSVISFLDGFGNTLQVNALGNGGKYEVVSKEDEPKRGLWYSNEYSFDPNHRLPSSYSTGGWSNYPHTDTGWNNYYKTPSKPKKKDTPPASVPERFAMDTKCTTYTEKYNVNPNDVYQITDETLEYAAEYESEMLVILCKELLSRSYQAEQKVAVLEEKKKKAELRIEELTKGVTNETA